MKKTFNDYLDIAIALKKARAELMNLMSLVGKTCTKDKWQPLNAADWKMLEFGYEMENEMLNTLKCNGDKYLKLFGGGAIEDLEKMRK